MFTTTMIRTTRWIICVLLFLVLFILFLLPRPVHTAAAWSVEGNRYIRNKLPNTLTITSQETTFRFPDESKILHEDHYSTNKDNADLYTEEKLPNRDFLYHNRRGERRNARGGLAFVTIIDDEMVPFIAKPKMNMEEDPRKHHLGEDECEPPYHALFQWF
jgi:hypothetical protein